MRYLFLLVLVLNVEALAGETLHVAPKGDDSAIGDAAHPLASFSGARDTLRRLRTEGRVLPEKVEFADGVYPLSSCLSFDSRDSGSAEKPVIYAAAPGSHPIFDAGLKIEGWKIAANAVWEAPLPKELSAGIEALWIKDRRATRSRYPATGFAVMNEVEILPLGKGREREVIALDAQLCKRLAVLPVAQLRQLQMVVYHKWDVTRRRILSFDPGKGSITTEGGTMAKWNSWGKGATFLIENFPSCEQAGEWSCDVDAQILRYHPLPGETLANTELIAPRRENFLHLSGESGKPLQHLRFEGLSFAHAQGLLPESGYEPMQSAAGMGAVIEVEQARHVDFDHCVIRHTGSWGVFFKNDCWDSSLRHCRLDDLGAGAIRIGANDVKVPLSGRIIIDDNILTRGGRVNASACGVLLTHGSDNQITHNEIHDFFYTGVSVGWVWGYAPSPSKRNLIAFNHIHQIGQGLLSDMGGVYTLGASEGTVVANNVFHDIVSHGYGGWALYTDEGSTGIIFENNLVRGTKTGGFHQHYGKDNIIRNNIFIEGQEQQLQATRVEDHLSFRFEHNLIWWANVSPTLSGPWDKIRYESGSNCYWNAAGKVDFLGRTLEAWQKAGHEQGSLIADPLFAAPERGDFRLDPKSPALKLGFRPFNPTQAGVRGQGEWRRLAAGE